MVELNHGSGAEPSSGRSTLKNAQAEKDGGSLGWRSGVGGETAEAAEQGGIVSRAKPADVPAEKGIKVSWWI